MKSIMILGEKWIINNKKTVKGSDDEESHGTCDRANKIVDIEECDNDTLYTQSVIHELCHAVFVESCVGETSLHRDVEEIMVEQIAKMLAHNFDIKPKGIK